MLRIDPSGGVAPYEQIRSQIVAQVASGELAPGTRLPAVRRLAGDLGLAPNTVARAYRELEAAGVVRTAGRNGTVVAPTGAGAEVAELIEELLERLAGLGIDGEAAATLVRQRVRDRASARQP